MRTTNLVFALALFEQGLAAPLQARSPTVSLLKGLLEGLLGGGKEGGSGQPGGSSPSSAGPLLIGDSSPFPLMVGSQNGRALTDGFPADLSKSKRSLDLFDALFGHGLGGSPGEIPSGLDIGDFAGGFKDLDLEQLSGLFNSLGGPSGSDGSAVSGHKEKRTLGLLEKLIKLKLKLLESLLGGHGGGEGGQGGPPTSGGAGGPPTSGGAGGPPASGGAGGPPASGSAGGAPASGGAGGPPASSSGHKEKRTLGLLEKLVAFKLKLLEELLGGYEGGFQGSEGQGGSGSGGPSSGGPPSGAPVTSGHKEKRTLGLLEKLIKLKLKLLEGLLGGHGSGYGGSGGQGGAGAPGAGGPGAGGPGGPVGPGGPSGPVSPGPVSPGPVGPGPVGPGSPPRPNPTAGSLSVISPLPALNVPTGPGNPAPTPSAGPLNPNNGGNDDDYDGPLGPVSPNGPFNDDGTFNGTIVIPAPGGTVTTIVVPSPTATPY